MNELAQNFTQAAMVLSPPTSRATPCRRRSEKALEIDPTKLTGARPARPNRDGWSITIWPARARHYAGLALDPTDLRVSGRPPHVFPQKPRRLTRRWALDDAIVAAIRER